MKAIIPLVAIGLSGFAPTLDAQVRMASPCDAAGNGVVRGVVEYEDSSFAKRGRGIFLTENAQPYCMGSTTDADVFIFEGVPDGTYELRLASGGLYPPEPVPILIAGSDTVEVVIYARREDALAQCIAFSTECAQTLSFEPLAQLMSEELAEFTYWRAALALAGVRVVSPPEWIACLRPMPSQAVLAALEILHPEIVPGDSCGLDNTRLRTMRHHATGREARVIAIGVHQTQDGGVLNVSYHIAGLNGAWLSCEWSIQDGFVTIGRCVTTAVS